MSNPVPWRRQFVHTILVVLLLLPLTVKAYDPDAGMVAARMLGEKKCLAFKINNRVETAAVFTFQGCRYIYHPAFGSQTMPDDPREAAKWFRGCMWIPVLCVPRTAFLERGCLPRAILEARATGGKVRLERDHAEAVKR